MWLPVRPLQGYPITLSVKQESDVDMIMSKSEKDRVWEELVKSSDKKMGVVRKERVVRRKERVEGVGIGRSYLSDLKLFVMLEVIGCGLFAIVEILKY